MGMVRVSLPARCFRPHSNTAHVVTGKTAPSRRPPYQQAAPEAVLAGVTPAQGPERRPGSRAADNGQVISSAVSLSCGPELPLRLCPAKLSRLTGMVNHTRSAARS
jgi:hypothetical protein